MPSYINKIETTDGVQHDVVGQQFVMLNCRSGLYGLHQYALVACSDELNGMVYNMSPMTTNGGTGNKTPNYNAKFPIGCSIYYHPDSVSYAANTNFSSKVFYTSYGEVDARYIAVTPSALNLANGSTSEVFLRVTVSDGYWSPYYKQGSITEFIVTSDNLSSGNFYIYLGKTSASNSYTFQLESNHPLYYYDGTQLIDYATWIASQNTQSGQSYLKWDMSAQTIGTSGVIVYSIGSSILDSLPNGFYKVTVQRHAYNSSNNTSASVCHMTLLYGENNSWRGIAASTSIIPAAIQTQDAYDPLGAITVVMVGFLTLGDQRKDLKLVQEGINGLNLGGEVPYGGDYIECLDNNDFILLERIG